MSVFDATAVHLSIVASREGTVADRIATAAMLGHGLLRLHITRPDGSVIVLHCMDADSSEVKYPLARKQ